MKDLLTKASKYRFGTKLGECFQMTMCLSKYMLEEEGIQLKTHIGGIRNSGATTVHLWSSYEGKTIDLTSHTQPMDRVQAEILGEKIEGFENAKRVSSKKINTSHVRSFSKEMVRYFREEDKNDITVHHIFLKNVKTGLVPYETLKNALDYKTKKNPALYQDFYDYMSKASA